MQACLYSGILQYASLYFGTLNCVRLHYGTLYYASLYYGTLNSFSYPEPFLPAVRRGALAKSKTGNHKNMVKDIYVIRTITFVVANQMPV